MENNIDFRRKYVFVDESGLKKHGASCSMVQEGNARRSVSSARRYQLEYFGLPIRARIDCNFSTGSKSKWLKETKIAGIKRGLPHRINSSHFLLFVEEMATVLNKLGLHNMYIVMDNAAIHNTPEVLQATRGHGHTALFLLPYSPFLNLIEECWAKIKKEACKIPLTNNEIIADHIEEAAKTVTVENCRGWIRHS